MTKIYMPVFLTLCGFANCFAQKTTMEYTLKQRIALEKFIGTHNEYEFIPETWFDEEVLKSVRNEWGFGKNYKPYCQANDFNNDGIKDFAVILRNTNLKISDDKNCAVIIFNGTRKGDYKFAYLGKEKFEDELGLTFQDKTLNVLVFESDNIGCFIPAGNGYLVEPCK